MHPNGGGGGGSCGGGDGDGGKIAATVACCALFIPILKLFVNVSKALDVLLSSTITF